MCDQRIEELIGKLAEARINYDSACERYGDGAAISEHMKKEYEAAKAVLFNYIGFDG